MACISVPCGVRPVSPFPGAPVKFPDGQNVPNPLSLPRHAMIRRATLQRLCPQGKQRRPRIPAAPLAQRARQRRPTPRRRQAPARGPAAVNALPRPIRNETQRPSPLLVGLGRVNTEPTALAGGTAALVGLPPSTPSLAPSETKRSTPAPCSWGGCASNPSQRHWPAALPTKR